MLKCQADVLLLPIIANPPHGVTFEQITNPKVSLLPSEVSEDTEIIFVCRKKRCLSPRIAYPNEEELKSDEALLNLYRKIYESFNSVCSHCEYNPQATNIQDSQILSDKS